MKVLSGLLGLSLFLPSVITYARDVDWLIGCWETHDAALTYTAYPAGQSPTTFVAGDMTPSSVVFSNSEHDYPQEIAYKLEEPELHATISALNGQNPQSFNKRRCE